jgi:DNA polymerase IIIc chi subunit
MIRSKSKVVLFQIKDVKSKLIKLLQISMHHFEKKEKLLIQVDNEISQKFVDELLWKSPIDSFLPHSSSDNMIEDFIVITKSKKNINQALYLFNLCQDVTSLDTSFKIIYDFDDYTTMTKQAFSQKRFLAYKNASLLIEATL